MRRLVFFAVPLLSVFVSSLGAQQVEPASTQPASTQSASTSPDIVHVVPPKPELTPRQAAELKGDVFMARKEFSEAAGAYEAILQGEPKNAQLLNKVAIAYQELGNLNRCERYYRKSIKADKNFASPINNLGTVEYEKKHYSKAILLYKKALVLKMETSTIYSNLGYAYFADKKFEQSINAFGQALKLDPAVLDHNPGRIGSTVQDRSVDDRAKFYFLLAKSFAEAGNFERSLVYLRKAKDEGYKSMKDVQTDPAFSAMQKLPEMQEVLAPKAQDAPH